VVLRKGDCSEIVSLISGNVLLFSEIVWMKGEESYLRNLIERAADEARTDLSWKGFKEMAFAIAEKTKAKLDAAYLKYTLYEGKSKSKPNKTKLDVIAQYVGYKNYRAFCESLDADPILQSMVGQYYCYVRMNKEQGKILRSPVEISAKDGQIHYHLKGGRLSYSGEITKREGCLFVLMKSPEGKSFYHVYRIGARPFPEVLQGIFSGVSTDFEPIGGRAILWRSNKPFDSMKTGKLDITVMQKSKQKNEKLLATYFQRKDSNNLSIKSVYTFGPEDLE
jgi:hypothetical protein